MNDVQPPRRPNGQMSPLRPRATVAPQPRQQPQSPERPVQAAPPAAPENHPSDILSSVSLQPLPPTSEKPKKSRRKKIILWVLIGFIVTALLAIAAGYTWYQQQLAPVDSANTATEQVVVKRGMGPSAIASMLEEKKLIKSAKAFGWYVRLHKTENGLQAGTFSLSQSMSLPEIVNHLKSGKTDTITITFYPGATLRDTTSTPEAKKTDVTTMLLKAGYSEEEIETALSKQYDHPLLASKPASADLEGYVYGETYQFASSTTVEQILTRTFDEMYKVIKDNNLEESFERQGLTLYKGITLASIVQREVPTASDQAAVARVFLNRITAGMNLGSDVTYQYIADKTGVARDPGLQSPYNTRIVTGLTPGPIAAPGKSALLAVANPATNDYLFFLSGDDDKTYFGKTQAEHEQNIANHCKEKCQIL